MRTVRGDMPNEMGDRLPAVDLGSGRTALSVTLGNFHTCALLDNFTTKCWGEGDNGRLLSGGTDDILVPPATPLDLADNYHPVRHLSMGLTHACAVIGRGQVRCWGDNTNGQLGQGNIDFVGHANSGAADQLNEINPVPLGTNTTAMQVAAGHNHSCALVRNTSNQQGVKCWGKNDLGQLGLGDTNNRGDAPDELGDSLPTLDFAGNIRQIGAGLDFTCVLLADNSVHCWGKNDVGQLGTGNTNTIGDDEEAGSATVAFPSGKIPASLSVGTDHACVRFQDDDVLCWGGNGKGQLGQGDTDHRGDNEVVSGLSVITLGGSDTALEVVAGDQSTCVLTDDYAVKCWGDNASGELGIDSDTTEFNTAQAGVDLVGTGEDTAWFLGLGAAHTCISLRWEGSTARGQLLCWGANGSGQLAQGDTQSRGDSTNVVSSGTALELGGILGLSLGGDSGCVLNADYQAQCWGEGGQGQLGYGNTDDLGDTASEISASTGVLDFGMFTIP